MAERTHRLHFACTVTVTDAELQAMRELHQREHGVPAADLDHWTLCDLITQTFFYGGHSLAHLMGRGDTPTPGSTMTVESPDQSRSYAIEIPRALVPVQ